MTARKLWRAFPDAGQELLLKTCLFEGDAAIESWQAWRTSVDVDDLDLASQRLLPLAYQTLSALGLKDAALSRYRSVARYVWYDNQSRIAQVEGLLALIASAQIPVMLLKGLALTPLYYRNWSLRPTNDIDILVPTETAQAAGALLARHGWRPVAAAPLGSAAFLSTAHAAAFRDGGYRELDLHWHLLFDDCAPDADRGYWARAQPFAFGATQALALSDTDQLFHTIVHAMRQDIVAPIRWVADAAMVLRHGAVDWDHFQNLALSEDFVARIRHALRYLAETFGLPIPQGVIAKLDASRISRIEVLEARLQGARIPRVAWQAGMRYLHYRRQRRHAAAPQSFPAYLRTVWGCENWNDTVRAGVRRLPLYFPGTQKA